MIFNKEVLKNHKKLLIGIGVFLVIIIVATIVVYNTNRKTPDVEQMESAIIESADNKTLRVEEIIIEDGDWRLVGVTNGEDDEGAYTILKKTGDTYAVIFNLRPRFTYQELASAGVPQSIISYLLSPEEIEDAQQPFVQFIDLLPYGDDYYTLDLIEATEDLLSLKARITPPTVISDEFQGSADIFIEFEKTKIADWLHSQNISDGMYTIEYTID